MRGGPPGIAPGGPPRRSCCRCRSGRRADLAQGAPRETPAPAATAILCTTPVRCAVTGCSIFIASMTNSTSPSLTSAPWLAEILTTVPTIGLVSASAPPAVGAAADGRVVRRRDGPPRGAGRDAAASDPGRTTSSRRPATSTVYGTRPATSTDSSASWGACHGSTRTSDCSSHRVCTANPVSGSLAVNSRVSNRNWSRGSVVGMPSTSNSARARRARASACGRSAPVTISFASIESKEPSTTAPSTSPVSTRTPGPAGTRHRVTVPGVGRKPRPTSSPLTRNSMLWPRCGDPRTPVSRPRRSGTAPAPGRSR